MLRDVSPLPGYREDVGLLLSILEDSTREWRGELAEPSVEAIVWQPVAGSYNIGALLLHMAFAELIWFQGVVADTPVSDEDRARLLTAETDVDAGKWPTPPSEPISFYFDILAEVRGRSLAILKDADPDAVFQRSRGSVSLRWIIGHIIQHDSYHGGQAVLLHEQWLRRGSDAS